MALTHCSLATTQSQSPSHVFIDEDHIGLPEIKGKGIFDLLEWPEDKDEPSFLQMGDDPQKVSPKKVRQSAGTTRIRAASSSGWSPPPVPRVPASLTIPRSRSPALSPP